MFSDDEVFRANCTIARQHVKKRLRQRGLVPYRCEPCGQTESWNGKPLVLQLEHKNGVNNDNRVENLCFICPNCHSQTDTYAGRGSKGLRRCDESQSIKAASSYRQRKKDADRAKLDQIIMDQSVRFGEWGWKTKFARLVGISAQKTDKWLTRVDAKFLENIVDQTTFGLYK